MERVGGRVRRVISGEEEAEPRLKRYQDLPSIQGGWRTSSAEAPQAEQSGITGVSWRQRLESAASDHVEPVESACWRFTRVKLVEADCASELALPCA